MADSPPFSPQTTRREFLAWLAVTVPALSALGATARRLAAQGAPFTTLTAAEARTFGAFAAQIVPAGALPGAEEAGVVYFADAALGSFFADLLAPVRAGLAEVDRRAQAATPPAADFAALPPAAQIAVIKQIEQAPVFQPMRTLVVLGMFSDPVHGGNRGGAGWRLLGLEHQPVYQPPFGWYDAEANR